LSQNINIVYKVDSSQVTASTAQVNAAKAATDKLTDSATKLGQQGSKNNIQFGNTIEGIRLKVQQLKAQIELTDRSDVKRLTALNAQYIQVQKQLDSYTGKLKQNQQAAEQATTATTGTASAFSKLTNIIAIGAIVAATKQIGEAIINATELTGKIDGVSRAFDNAFPNSVKTLNDLRAATHGTVTDFELMQRTLQASNLGVDVSKLGILFEFAAARAQQTGESVDYLVDSIVRGVGRKSVLVLDNLGISATRLKEQFNGASIASQSVADVTAGVAAIAKVELEKMGGYVETGATKVGVLKAQWETLIQTLSRKISSSAIVDFFAQTISDVDDLLKGEKALSEERAKARAAEDADQVIQSEAYQNAKGNIEEQIKILSLEIVKRVESINARKEEIKLDEQLKAAQNQGYLGAGARERIQKDIDNRELLNKSTQESIDILKKYLIELRNLENVTTGSADTLDVLEQKVKDLNEEIQNTDKISTPAGINRARELKFEVQATQDKIDAIKHQINLEEDLRDRRARAKDPATVTTLSTAFDKDKATKDFEGLISDLNAHSESLTITLPTPVVPESDWDKIKDSFSEHIQDVEGTLQNIIADQVQASVNNVQNGYQAMIRATQLYYDNQISLAGDNEKAKQKLRLEEQKRIDAIRKQQFEAQKLANEKAALINGAVAVARAFADYQYPYSLVVAALAGAQVLSQVGIIENTTYTPQGFAKGVIKIQGKGSATSDSIPARLSVGESVMTAQETSTSEKTLRMIRAKKLNDEVLDRIMSKAGSNGGVIGFDDSRLLAATKRVEKAAAGNDIVRKGAHIYEAKKQGDNLKVYVRSKYLS
jgi:hypothetical protein